MSQYSWASQLSVVISASLSDLISSFMEKINSQEIPSLLLTPIIAMAKSSQLSWTILLSINCHIMQTRAKYSRKGPSSRLSTKLKNAEFPTCDTCIVKSWRSQTNLRMHEAPFYCRLLLNVCSCLGYIWRITELRTTLKAIKILSEHIICIWTLTMQVFLFALDLLLFEADDRQMKTGVTETAQRIVMFLLLAFYPLFITHLVAGAAWREISACVWKIHSTKYLQEKQLVLRIRRVTAAVMESREWGHVPRAQENSLKLTRPSWFSSIRRKIQRERVLLVVQKAQGSSRENSTLNCW